MKYLILTPFERELFEMWIGHKINEGDMVLGGRVVWAKLPSLGAIQDVLDRVKQ